MLRFLRRIPTRILAGTLVAAALLGLFAIRRANSRGEEPVPESADRAQTRPADEPLTDAAPLRNGVSNGLPRSEPTPGSEATLAERGATTDRDSRAARHGAAPVDSSAGSRFGEGFLVWESIRSGEWRLWTERLDRGGLRQLSPDDGTQHCCPQISPDGRGIAYLALPRDIESYGRRAEVGELRWIAADGSSPRVLSPSAQTYGRGNRAVVWLDPGRLQYIDGQARSVVLDLASGAETVVATAAPGERGWLLDPTQRFATNGWPTFSVYRRGERTVLQRRRLGGCEPAFSQDGRFGVWVAGPGGPLSVMNLSTRGVATLLTKDDPLLGGQGYLYFPMPSPDGSLLAFAASRGEHDHSRGNYDVFLVDLDPATFTLAGRPQRMTDDPASDRYPTVWTAPLPLGRHFGEAPRTVQFAAPGGDWQWSFGDGESASGPAPKSHRYAAAGVYRAAASRGGETLSGLVVLRAPAPPEPGSVVVLGDRTLEVRFDEPIDASAASARLASGAAVASIAAGSDPDTVEIRLAQPIRARDTLRLEGVSDRAERPNAMSPRTFDLRPPSWPSSHDGLVFLWQSADAPNLVAAAGEPDEERSFVLEPRGAARLDHAYAMRLDGGAFVSGADAGEAVASGAERKNEVTVEAVITLDRPVAAADLVAFGGGGRSTDWTLHVEGTRLSVALRTGPDSTPAQPLGEITPGQPTHLVVTYTPGVLRGYRDGERVLETNALVGGLRRWRAGRLVFGEPGGAGWSGTVDHVAIYARALDAAEAAENYRLLEAGRRARPSVPRLRVEATLVARSKPPTLREISPYREALAVAEYAVERVLEGESPGPTLRVAEWVLLDGEPRPAGSRSDGARRVLLLEPYAAQPQLESVVLRDTLPPAARPLFYDLEP